MERFAFELSNALAVEADLKIVKWGGSKKWLPLVLPWLALSAFARLLRGGVDVVHSQDGVMAPICWLLARLFRKPYVVVVHGLDITHDTWLYQNCVVRFVANADRVICISRAAAAECLKRGVPADKTTVITLAVGDDIHGQASRNDLYGQLGLPKNVPTLLTVGRLVPRKGVAWFISEVLPGLAAQYPDLVYLVAGTGSEQANIETAIAESRLKNNVRLLGKVSDSLRRALYNGADLFVMPNIPTPGNMEGFGLVLLEAALCERPIVAVETEGITDAVKAGESAVLVPALDAAAFERKISVFLDDPAKARAFGKQARRHTLKHYQWPAIAKQYVAEYALLAPDRQNP
jgi:glycosyltransferase involved in cell wall biosynthesis